jgi:2-haloacid dehalogenase
VFGDAAVRIEWFQTMLQSAFLTTITGPYKPFGEHFRAALAITAQRRGLRVSRDDERTILAGVRTLPAYPDVRPALERLRSAGFRLAALTNSTAEVEETQLRNAKLDDLFEKALSADSGKQLKPAAEAYINAARELGVEPAEMRMVAAHVWDVHGALRAGCAAAFVERPGAVWNPLLERPDIIGPDLGEIAKRVIEVDR